MTSDFTKCWYPLWPGSRLSCTFSGTVTRSLITLDPADNEQKDAKETAGYTWVLVVTELFNMAVNYFDAKQSARYSRVLSVTELALSGPSVIGI